MAISLDSIYSSGSGQRYNPQIANLTLKGQVSRALISGFPAQYNSGLNADLLYRVYDMKAISPATLSSYLNKMQEAQDGGTKETETVTEPEKAKSEEPVAQEEPAVETQTGYVSLLAEGRGYDLDAIKKIQDDMTKFYSNPDNKYKTYGSVDVVG